MPEAQLNHGPPGHARGPKVVFNFINLSYSPKMVTPQDNIQIINANVPELSVSDLSNALKRTVEESFGRVRVRGELSKVAFPASGHMYSALKDDGAVIDAVCWRGQLGKLRIKPAEGLEVICTGRLTTYPARSSYQLIIEQMELAGVGAILKMIEDRRVKLAAEGLFDESRKRDLPYLPQTIGIVTSPTGAVIRDILHRLADRFPVNVLIWPVSVQGDKAAAEVTAAINGFNSIPENGPVPRPDVLIVARGGGSIEDLMPFNEENVVRAAAMSKIPLISAVGHETDTTLIDYASDRRAPTPTAAAEFAVPVREDLIYTVDTYVNRMVQGMRRHFREQKADVTALSARLGSPDKFLEMPAQKLDHADMNLRRVMARQIDKSSARVNETHLISPQKFLELSVQKLSHAQVSLDRALTRQIDKATACVNERAAKLRHPAQYVAEQARVLSIHTAALTRTGAKLTDDPTRKLDQAGRLLETLSFTQVLARGYAVVRNDVNAGATLTPGTDVSILFGDKVTKTAKINP